MKKIMFNDKYGLTTAVLNGSKTQTRRLVSSEAIEKAEQYRVDYFNDTLDGISLEDMLVNANNIMGVPSLSSYKVGEEVAIAQCYCDINKVCYNRDTPKIARMASFFNTTAGWKNKMFVQAALMPHHIKITNISVERLQDISDDDCMKEGIISEDMLTPRMEDVTKYYFGGSFVHGEFRTYSTPREAYAALIDKVSGKGTWDKNLWVFVYDFQLVD